MLAGFAAVCAGEYAADEPIVDRSSILIDTVRRGDLIRKVDGYGKLRRAGAGIEAVVEIPAAKAQEIRPGQPVLIDSREGLLHGAVASVGDVRDQERPIIVKVDAGSMALSEGERVASSIQVDEIKSVLMVGRTGLVTAERTVALYKVDVSKEYADRVEIRTGKMNDRQVEIRSGLAEGDKVIITPANVPQDTPRIRLK